MDGPLQRPGSLIVSMLVVRQSLRDLLSKLVLLPRIEAQSFPCMPQQPSFSSTCISIAFLQWLSLVEVDDCIPEADLKEKDLGILNVMDLGKAFHRLILLIRVAVNIAL